MDVDFGTKQQPVQVDEVMHSLDAKLFFDFVAQGGVHVVALLLAGKEDLVREIVGLGSGSRVIDEIRSKLPMLHMPINEDKYTRH